MCGCEGAGGCADAGDGIGAATFKYTDPCRVRVFKCCSPDPGPASHGPMASEAKVMRCSKANRRPGPDPRNYTSACSLSEFKLLYEVWGRRRA